MPGACLAASSSIRRTRPLATGLPTKSTSTSPKAGGMSSMNCDSPVTCATAESCGMFLPTTPITDTVLDYATRLSAVGDRIAAFEQISGEPQQAVFRQKQAIFGRAADIGD